MYYRINGDTLTAIADAIRDKGGGAETYTPAEMAEAITALEGASVADVINQSDIPDYVKTEAAEVLTKVRAAQNDNTLTFFVISDPHHCATQSDGWAAQTNESNLHAMMGAKVLAYAINADFAICNGDFTFGNTATTTAQLKEQVHEIKSWFGETFRGLPQFYTVGNHDTGEYNELVGADWCMSDIMGASSATEFGGTGIGNPCYYDLTEKKIRIINLNTCEGEMTGESYVVSDGQLEWFANTLKSVGGKSDASEWGIIVMGHYPLDFGGARYLSDVLYQYMQGGAYTRNSVSVNFSGSNGATVIGNFHGHTHCLKSDNLHYYNSGTTPTAYDAKRLATPAASFYRNNEYTSAVHGVVFGEDTSYEKTADTGDDTAFRVNVVDLAEKVIHSFCYGAGYDRVVSYGPAVYYSVQSILTNTTNSNATTAIKEGESYTAEITFDSSCTLESITVTMGGTDITSTAVSGATITIASVTGDIVITASAKAPATNLIPLSTTTIGGTELYNGGLGYKTGTRINSSSVEVAIDGMCCTGYINVPESVLGSTHTIRIKNVTIAGPSTVYLIGFVVSSSSASGYMAGETFTSANLVADDNGVITITNTKAAVVAWRLSCGVIDGTSIITINEEID